MKPLYLWMTPALLAASSIAASAGAAPKYVPGELLVKFKKTSAASTRNGIIGRMSGRRIREIGNEGLTHVQIAEGQSVEDAVSNLSQESEVEYAQPNYIYHLTTVPNDPDFGQMWGLKNTGQTVTTVSGSPDPAYATYQGFPNPGTPGQDIGAEAAWQYITDCSSVIVAVLDTGVNYNHVDLAANMWNGGSSYPNHGYDFVLGNNNPMDQFGHGTHVAGTIAAVGNNGIGTTGVCWKARIMAVRVLDENGSGTDSEITQGIVFAAQNGAKVINMSLGGPGIDSAMNTAIATASTYGTLVVVAAGNNGTNNDDGTDTFSPCDLDQPNILCVAALDQAYGLATFSNYGTTHVHVGAPGVNILSTWLYAQSGQSTDPMTGGWTFSSTASSPWGYTSYSGDAVVANPANYNGSSAQYAKNNDARAYKTFTVPAALKAQVGILLFVNTESSTELFNLDFIANSSSDPFAGSGTNLASTYGNYGSSVLGGSFDISTCVGTTCTIGLQLKTDSSTTDYGVAVSQIQITTYTANTTSYNVDSGTSMATPHTAGLATMLFAYNPSYTYQDVMNSIKGGGVSTPSLVGKTATGNAISAIGSLTYISPPTGVSATQP